MGMSCPELVAEIGFPLFRANPTLLSSRRPKKLTVQYLAHPYRLLISLRIQHLFTRFLQVVLIFSPPDRSFLFPAGVTVMGAAFLLHHPSYLPLVLRLVFRNRERQG